MLSDVVEDTVLEHGGEVCHIVIENLSIMLMVHFDCHEDIRVQSLFKPVRPIYFSRYTIKVK